jgi:hypothetical protein
MKLLLVCLFSVFVFGLRSGSRRSDVRLAVPLLIGCCVVAFAYLSQRVL